MTPNKQLQRTVIRRRGRAARASFHCAHAARWLAQRAAAELRRYASNSVVHHNAMSVVPARWNNSEMSRS